MTQKLGAQLLTFPEIFAGHHFSVPDYQRGYAWDDTQVKDLLTDIEHLMLTPGQGQHFTGTLVVNRTAGSDRFDIVDGQQRLTTIVILMRCLLPELVSPASAQRIAEHYLQRGSRGNERIVLQLGADSREFFERVVLGDDSNLQLRPALSAHLKLQAARRTIENWLKGKSAGFADRILPVIEERLGLLVYNPAESTEIGIMFEVINNRGKDLSELEMVKNYLIYVATKLGVERTREKVNTRWSSILRNLHVAQHTSAADEGSFLRAVSVLHLSLNKTDSSYVHRMLRHKFLKIDDVLATQASRAAAVQQIESFVEVMEKASNWYAVLFGQQYGDLDKSVVTALERLRAQAQHANIMPLFLAVMIRHGGQLGPDKVLARLLELIEKINFRVYLSRGITLRTDSGQGWLYAMASGYFNRQHEFATATGEQGLDDDMDLKLEKALVYFGLYFAKDHQIEESLVLGDDDQDDFYNWRGLKYFLMCYEASLKESKTVKIDNILNARSSGKSGDYFSVEHIWATRHEEETYNRPKDKHVRRRLGNFVLLELNLNIAGSNHDIQTKIDLYSGKAAEGVDNAVNPRQPSEMAQVRELIRDTRAVLKDFDEAVFEDRRHKPYYDLHNKLCDRREQSYTKFALKQWSLKNYQGYEEALQSIQGEEAEV